ncbi:SRPBCC family protein [Pseudomonas sp. LFM046]|uniref:SRPBCC family protein n=1 Tax=Pseudomonas sp. LFM046 TaxID=1608357 RepID=UPI0005CFD4D7|nr:SRPBCC family protein [Pseudomonas sp. LFM046]
MSHDTQAFRDRYRAGIHPLYNAWLHGGFVLLYGAACLSFFLGRLNDVRPWEWLVVPAALMFFSWGEYTIHKNLGHNKTRLGALFYKRHTGDHHSFFVAGQMTWESARDWRVILFPAWLIVLFSTGLFPAWWLLSFINANVAALFVTTLLAGYLSYEVFHACEHLPAGHPIARLPWIRHMRRLHELHHRRDLMQSRNFNLVFPLMDCLKGTLHWEPLEQERSMTRMQHSVDIARPPEHVLAYASTATRWPEWHPSSLQVEGPIGPLPAGSHFEEDIHAGGRSGHLSWDVTEYSPGRRWRATAHGTHGLGLLLTYECEKTANGTRFVRTLEYGFSGWVMRLANRLVMRRTIDRESVESMRQLKAMAEQHIEAASLQQRDTA